MQLADAPAVLARPDDPARPADAPAAPTRPDLHPAASATSAPAADSICAATQAGLELKDLPSSRGRKKSGRGGYKLILGRIWDES